METIPEVIPPLPQTKPLYRQLDTFAGLDWLLQGWRDLFRAPVSSFTYGLAMFLGSWIVLWTIFSLDYDYILFPALSGFMIIGPLLAIGMYEKSRRLASGAPVTLSYVFFVKPASGGQVLYTGVLLCVLMMLWMRAAVLLYGLFFGMQPFSGIEHIHETIFLTQRGNALLAVGTLVGGLFAAFSFAISVFSIPMQLAERTDALTAMGLSLALVWNNLRPMLVWGCIVFSLFIAGVVTGFLGFIIIFPLLGHATWHAYLAVRKPESPAYLS
ncbi:MAG: DUF2189 domain-containing protein [bacterium]|nr:DUF2189 domain-containing protein [bacterium]